MSRKQIKEYDILRVVVTFLVIIGHCTYASIKTNSYGIWDYSAYTISGLSLFYKLARDASSLIYTAHMQLYMMLSGALFSYSEKMGGGYNSLHELSKKKAKNLLIPFFVVTLCYAVPLKWFSGYYSESTNLFKDILFGQILLQGNTYLWFLPTLFLIFLLIHFMNGHLRCSARIKLFLLFTATCFSGLIPITLLSQPLSYAFWFYAGFCFEHRREQVNRHVDLHPLELILAASLWIVLALINARLMPTDGYFFLIDQISRTVCAYAGCYTIYGCSYLLTKTELPENTVFQHIREHTFGLYLYSDPLNYPILLLSVQWFGNAVFITNLGSLLLYACRFILTTTVAYGLSWLIRKCRLKYLA